MSARNDRPERTGDGRVRRRAADRRSRQKRLAEALRKNLAKRKRQARGRAGDETPPAEDAT